MRRRPVSVLVVGGCLILAGCVAGALGLVATAMSSCCGSSEPADPTYAFIGLALTGALLWAGWGLLSGRASRLMLLVLTAPAPLACVVGAASSSDLSMLVLPAALAWAGLAVLLSRPTFAGWLGGAQTDLQRPV